MLNESLIDHLHDLALSGKRSEAETAVNDALLDGISPEELADSVFWPIIERVDSQARVDDISCLAANYAIRLLRTLVDHNQSRYLQQPSMGMTILLFCGNGMIEELAALLMADLLEAQGFDVRFGGGGVAADEILAEAGRIRPDTLLMFASAATDAPRIRGLIDYVRDINACPEMQIVVGGGIFNRAVGLAEEIGADNWGYCPSDVAEKILSERCRRASADQRTVGSGRPGMPPKAA